MGSQTAVQPFCMVAWAFFMASACLRPCLARKAAWILRVARRSARPSGASPMERPAASRHKASGDHVEAEVPSQETS